MDIIGHEHIMAWTYYVMETFCHESIMSWHKLSGPYNFFSDRISLWSTIEISHGFHGYIQSWTYYVMELLCHGKIMSWKRYVMDNVFRRRIIIVAAIECPMSRQSIINVCHGCHGNMWPWTYCVMEMSGHAKIMSWKQSVMERMLSWKHRVVLHHFIKCCLLCVVFRLDATQIDVQKGD